MIPEKTIAAIIKAMVRSPDGCKDFFDVLAVLFQGNTLAPFLFILSLDYVLRISIDALNDTTYTLENARSRRFPAIKFTNADYTDDLGLITNKIGDAEKLLHALEDAAAQTGVYISANKTEYVCYNQNGEIKIIKGKALNKVENFTYLGSNISSTVPKRCHDPDS